MIIGIGIDMIELNRIEEAIGRNKRFIRRVLTEEEQRYYYQLDKPSRQIEFIAGRFAAKEAFSKACGTGIGKLSFQHMTILPNENGAPKMSVKGYEHQQIHLSISHSKAHAIAQVILSISE